MFVAIKGHRDPEREGKQKEYKGDLVTTGKGNEDFYVELGGLFPITKRQQHFLKLEYLWKNQSALSTARILLVLIFRAVVQEVAS